MLTTTKPTKGITRNWQVLGSGGPEAMMFTSTGFNFDLCGLFIVELS